MSNWFKQAQRGEQQEVRYMGTILAEVFVPSGGDEYEAVSQHMTSLVHKAAELGINLTPQGDYEKAR